MSVATDAPISPETELYRRIPPTLEQGLVYDENRDCVRLSSAIFNTQRMSVVIEDALRADGREPLDVLEDYPDDFLVAIKAELAVNNGQEIERVPEDDEPAHAEVVGKMNKKKARKFCKAAKWIKKPDNLCPEDNA